MKLRPFSVTAHIPLSVNKIGMASAFLELTVLSDAISLNVSAMCKTQHYLIKDRYTH